MVKNVTEWFIRAVAGIGTIGAAALLLFVFFLGFVVVTDYRPASVEPAETLHNPPPSSLVPTETPVRVTTFNIGYAGLDAGQDFFMDGGVGSRSRSLEQTHVNMDGIISFITGHGADIYALQEVDRKSSRSFDIDQVSMITEAVGSEYGAWFAWNYRVRWVPVPVTRPMGYANSGLLTLSRFHSTDATRYALPGDEPVPKRYFDLKRAVTEHVFPVENGRDLYLVNLHLSAFDKGGTVRAQQVAFLTGHIRNLYRQGHYVILAGDWNHLLDMSVLEGRTEPLPEWIAILPDEFLALDFTLAFDGSVNTVRDNAAPYVAGRNFETVIDGFYISNNITILKTEGSDLGFRHSDHNPVTVTVVLN